MHRAGAIVPGFGIHPKLACRCGRRADRRQRCRAVQGGRLRRGDRHRQPGPGAPHTSCVSSTEPVFATCASSASCESHRCSPPSDCAWHERSSDRLAKSRPAKICCRCEQLSTAGQSFKRAKARSRVATGYRHSGCACDEVLEKRDRSPPVRRPCELNCRHHHQHWRVIGRDRCRIRAISESG